MTPEHMAELHAAVLARFQQELTEASDLQLEHLAYRAEGRYATDLGARERELVDFERARRAVATGMQVTA